jgi:ATP-dependent DNA ligase
VVAFGESGKPSFNILQNYSSSKSPLVYYVFDILILSGRDFMAERLDERRTLIEKRVSS